MKAIIENGKTNYGIQNCSILTSGIGLVFQNNDLQVNDCQAWQHWHNTYHCL